MIEQLIPTVIAIITGGGFLFNRVHSRMHELDKRIDEVELKVATNYVAKPDFNSAINKMELHMLRIEEKLDTLMRSSTPCPSKE